MSSHADGPVSIAPGTACMARSRLPKLTASRERPPGNGMVRKRRFREQPERSFRTGQQANQIQRLPRQHAIQQIAATIERRSRLARGNQSRCGSSKTASAVRMSCRWVAVRAVLGYRFLGDLRPRCHCRERHAAMRHDRACNHT